MEKLFVFLLALTATSIAQAQTFDHRAAVAINANIAAVIAQYDTAQASIIAGGDKRYVQALCTPSVVPNGEAAGVMDYARKAGSNSKSLDDLIPGIKPAGMGLVQICGNEYLGPSGIGYEITFRVSQANGDGACAVAHPGGEPCVWSWREHFGSEDYRDAGTGVWVMEALPE